MALRVSLAIRALATGRRTVALIGAAAHLGAASIAVCYGSGYRSRVGVEPCPASIRAHGYLPALIGPQNDRQGADGTGRRRSELVRERNVSLPQPVGAGETCPEIGTGIADDGPNG